MHRGEYGDLRVRQEAMNLIDLIYKVTKIFPKEELFGLCSQIKRAATSIALNIAEGNGRKTDKDFAHFIHIAYGSCVEVEVCIKIALRQNFITQDTTAQLLDLCITIKKMLYGLHKHIE